jgi:iduronate 2-sulfatase
VAALKESTAGTKDAVFHVYPRGERIGRAVRTARHRLVEWKRPGEAADTAIIELYNYERDPDETKNLAGEQPEVVAELRAILDRLPEAKPQVRVAQQTKKANTGKRRAAERTGR